MSKQYIKQKTSTNFVYPNKIKNEYDVEIIHSINDNSPTGTINSATITGFTSDGFGLNLDLTYVRNGAEMFPNQLTGYNLYSILMMMPGEQYFKPWRVIDTYNSLITLSTFTGETSTFTINVTKEMFDMSALPEGEYELEVRFIGWRAVDVLCGTVSAVGTTPTPTPTPTPSATPGLSPTPTPTITPTVSITPTITPTPSITPSGYLLPLTQYCYIAHYVCGDTLHCLSSTSYQVCFSMTYWDEYGTAHIIQDCRDSYPDGLTVMSSAVPDVDFGLSLTSCDETCAAPVIESVTTSVIYIYLPPKPRVNIIKSSTNSNCTGMILQYDDNTAFNTPIEVDYSGYCGNISIQPFNEDQGKYWYFRIKEICGGTETSDWSNTGSVFIPVIT